MYKKAEAEQFVKFVKKRMIYIRNLRGFSQQQIANVLHVHRSTYSYCETGKVEPSLQLLYRLACFYGISPSAFFPKWRIEKK